MNISLEIHLTAATWKYNIKPQSENDLLIDMGLLCHSALGMLCDLCAEVSVHGERRGDLCPSPIVNGGF